MTLLIPLGLLAGLLLAAVLGLPWWTSSLPLGLGAASLLAARRPAHVAVGLALAAGALGVLRADVGTPSAAGAAGMGGALGPLVESAAPAVAEPGTQAGTPPAAVTALRGVVADEPSPRERAQLVRLDVEAARLATGEWRDVRGVAHVTARLTPEVQYGDVLEVHGRVQTPELGAAGAGPGYATFLRRQGVEAVVSFPTVRIVGHDPGSPVQAALIRLRGLLAEAIERHLPEPHASLVEGILIGRRATMPRELTDQLRVTGLSHVTAVSGFNLSILVAAVVGVFGLSPTGRTARRLAGCVLASLALWGFVALVGPSGSVLRAAAMAQIALVGRAAGRAGTAGGMLLWGSALLALWRPGVVADVGWQLSFLGTAGLVWLSAPLERRLAWIPALVRGPLAATLAAQVAVFPVLASVFGSVSLVAPLANVLVLPLVPWIMLGGALVAAAGLLFVPAAPLAAALTWAPTAALLAVVRWTASLPWAAVDFPPLGPAGVALYLAALVAGCAWLETRAQAEPAAALPATPLAGAGPPAPLGARLGRLALVALGALACAGVAMARPQEAWGGDASAVLEVPHVAEGGLLLLRAPDGTRLLVNGGPTAGGAAALLGESLRPWDRTVDVAIAADPREANVTGLARVLERYPVGLFVDGGPTGAAAAGPYRLVRETAQTRAVRRVRTAPGDVLQLGRSGIQAQILSVPAEGSVGPSAVRLEWGTFSVLIPGDGTAAQVRDLLAGEHDLRSTVLALTDRTLRSPEGARLVRAADPELVVVQGQPRSGAEPAAPLPPGDMDLPTAWHVTATDGPLRLRVAGDGTYAPAG